MKWFSLVGLCIFGPVTGAGAVLFTQSFADTLGNAQAVALYEMGSFLLLFGAVMMVLTGGALMWGTRTIATTRRFAKGSREDLEELLEGFKHGFRAVGPERIMFVTAKIVEQYIEDSRALVGRSRPSDLRMREIEKKSSRSGWWYRMCDFFTSLGKTPEVTDEMREAFMPAERQEHLKRIIYLISRAAGQVGWDITRFTLDELVDYLKENEDMRMSDQVYLGEEELRDERHGTERSRRRSRVQRPNPDAALSRFAEEASTVSGVAPNGHAH